MGKVFLFHRSKSFSVKLIVNLVQNRLKVIRGCRIEAVFAVGESECLAFLVNYFRSKKMGVWIWGSWNGVKT